MVLTVRLGHVIQVKSEEIMRKQFPLRFRLNREKRLYLYGI